ncbi:MAG: hypothetical protein M5U32_06275 [Myxococcota bacterium]|nr:hypothetical protein [Myxococcota bacterium]
MVRRPVVGRDRNPPAAAQELQVIEMPAPRIEADPQAETSELAHEQPRPRAADRDERQRRQPFRREGTEPLAPQQERQRRQPRGESHHGPVAREFAERPLGRERARVAPLRGQDRAPHDPVLERAGPSARGRREQDPRAPVETEREQSRAARVAHLHLDPVRAWPQQGGDLGLARALPVLMLVGERHIYTIQRYARLAVRAQRQPRRRCGVIGFERREEARACRLRASPLPRVGVHRIIDHDPRRLRIGSQHDATR